MIYFLINNNYHLDLDLKLAKQLSGYQLGLIQVPYSLNVIDNSDVFSKIFYFPERMYLSLRHPFQIIRIKKNVDKIIIPSRDDILLVHAERDLVNQHIIQSFFNVKAKIYLLEDGTASICQYNMTPQKAPLKSRIKNLILQKVYNYKYTKIGIYGAEIIHTMHDSIFNGVIVNFGNTIKREIPLFKLISIKDSLEIIFENGAIFFNQPMYLFYLSEEEYIEYLNKILKLSRQFTPFYFKFHPSDTDNVKTSITGLINKNYTNVVIVPENDIAENLVDKYLVRYAITFTSTAALNLINKGIIPIFLISLINNAFPNPAFYAFEQFLETINCITPKSLSDIKPGFCAFPNAIKSENSNSLENILNLHND